MIFCRQHYALALHCMGAFYHLTPITKQIKGILCWSDLTRITNQLNENSQKHLLKTAITTNVPMNLAHNFASIYYICGNKHVAFEIHPDSI